MRIHVLQHVDFEDEAYIGEWALEKNHSVTRTLLHQGETLPAADSFDMLVVMGGPMNVYETDQYPWLTAEKTFIKAAIFGDKKVLGICLGAQLLADCLGGKVTQNAQKEIGWFDVEWTMPTDSVKALQGLSQKIMAYHWHGDTFSIPDGAIAIAKSEATANQGFIYKDKVVALQFHLESTPKSIQTLVKNCAAELIEKPFIQTKTAMFSKIAHAEKSNKTMAIILDNLQRM